MDELIVDVRVIWKVLTGFASGFKTEDELIVDVGVIGKVLRLVEVQNDRVGERAARAVRECVHDMSVLSIWK